jgi:hypothetical protein
LAYNAPINSLENNSLLGKGADGAVLFLVVELCDRIFALEWHHI